MRILCVIDSLGSGGAQRQIVYLACGLVRQGHEVEFFLYHPGQNHFRPELDRVKIEIHEARRNKRTGFCLEVLRQLSRLMSDRQYEAVISFQVTANIYVALARFAYPHCLFVACERNSSSVTPERCRRLLAWFANVSASHVVCNSVSQAQYISRLPGLSKKTSAIWNGYPVGVTSTSRRFIKGRVRRLLVVGRVTSQKNGLRLLQAMKHYFDKHGTMPSVHWAGRRDADSASLQYQNELDSFLENHPEIAKNWRWLGEVKTIDRLYTGSDAVILPSLFEGLPNVICEAMISGCPVIASDVCDHPLLIGREERGLLFDPLSSLSICEAIERLETLPFERREEMVVQARRFAEEHLSIEKMVKGYEALLYGSATKDLRSESEPK